MVGRVSSRRARRSQQVRRREGQRTYRCPALEQASTRRSKKALFSDGVTSHSFIHFSTSVRETCSTCSSSFVLAMSRSAL